MSKNQALMSRWGRLILGLFVFGWINAVAQPCAMALAAAVDDKPTLIEAPAGDAHHAHGHHADAAQENAAGGGCGHCPGGGATGCLEPALDAAPHCYAGADVIPESRLKLPGPRDLPDDIVLPSVDPPNACRPPPTPSSLLPAQDEPPRDGPALNLRFCVFLK